ncbi:MAG: DUF58 domain-containing protein [Haloferacaceae archaeon]
MRLTRRGWALVGLVAAGIAMAYASGERALDAVVVPCLVALAAALVQGLRPPAPPVTRVLPPDDQVGTDGTVALRFDADDPFPARVVDALPPGVEGDATVEAVVGAEPARYRVRYARRGRHRVGPATVHSTDALGLVEASREVGGRDPVLVYPPVRSLPPAALALVRAEFVDSRSRDRDEFDGLREYVRGDSLRDVDWKSSAKREDLIVQEFAGARPVTGVVLAATGSRGRGDAMAEAAATLGDALLREGVPVTLVTAEGERTVEPESREDLLAALATANPGVVPREGRADVLVDARDDAVRVRVGGVETTYGDLRAGIVGPSAGSRDGDRDGRDGTTPPPSEVSR